MKTGGVAATLVAGVSYPSELSLVVSKESGDTGLVVEEVFFALVFGLDPVAMDGMTTPSKTRFSNDSVLSICSRSPARLAFDDRVRVEDLLKSPFTASMAFDAATEAQDVSTAITERKCMRVAK